MSLLAQLANTPKPPYYAVIFTSIRTDGDNGYATMAEEMVRLATKQAGFLGMESAREHLGITVSYWQDLAAIKAWKNNIEHLKAQKLGKEKWYAQFNVRIAKVEKSYAFTL